MNTKTIHLKKHLEDKKTKKNELGIVYKQIRPNRDIKYGKFRQSQAKKVRQVTYFAFIASIN